MTKPMTSDSEEHEHKLCYCAGRAECHECGVPMDDVEEEGSSTDAHANASVSRKLVKEAQSEAPSVDAILVNLYLGENTTEKIPNWKAQMKNPELADASAKINRLIDEARLDEARFIDANIIGSPRKVTTNERIKARIEELSNNLSKEKQDD